MESEDAILALAALAQSTRLDVFRLLVKHEQEGIAAGDIAKAAASPELYASVEKAFAEINATLASYETIKAFAILPADFSEATGELTPA